MASVWDNLTSALESNDGKRLADALNQIQGSNRDKPKDGNQILKRILSKLQNDNLQIRYLAFGTSVKLLESDCDLDTGLVKDFCSVLASQNILDLTQNNDDDFYEQLHSAVCGTIKELHIYHQAELMQHFSTLGQYLVNCTTSESREIATAASNYWRHLPNPPVESKFNDAWIPPVLKQMAKLIPALVNNMVYHPSHTAFMESVNQSSADKDMPADIEKLSNLRNFAAMGFENLCRIFPSESTAIFVPLMDQWLKSEDWMQKEAVILATGAFLEAVGQSKQLQGVYPELVNKLLQGYSHPKPLLRSITCFTMQQFINMKLKKDPYSRMLKCTLALLNDEYREVQDMALRALAAILAYAERDVAPQSAMIIDALCKANPTLKGNLRFTYYECIGHMFGRMGVLLDTSDVDRLIHPLLDDWQEVIFDKSCVESFIHMSQSLCITAIYSKHLFAPYNDQVLSKIMPFIRRASGGDTSHLSEDDITRYMISMLDLISAIFDGQGQSVKSCVEKYDVATSVINILQDGKFSPSVYGSALAVLGHMCQHCPATVQSHLDHILDILRSKLNHNFDDQGILNNALWTLAQVAEKADSKQEKLEEFCEKLGDIIKQQNLEHTVLINAAVALTGLGRVWPEKVITILKDEGVFVQICLLLQTEFPRDAEKFSIFRNLCSILSENTKLIEEPLWPYFIASAAIVDLKGDENLRQSIRNLLHSVRSVLGNQGWNRANQQLGSQVAYTIRKRYKMY